MLDFCVEARGFQARQDDLIGHGGHHGAALNAMVFDDAAGIFLRGFTGVFGGDGAKGFLVDEMLGRGGDRGEAYAEAQKDFHADESTGNEWFGVGRLAADLRRGTQIRNWAANERERCEFIYVILIFFYCVPQAAAEQASPLTLRQASA
jgi:hypothetical protein